MSILSAAFLFLRYCLSLAIRTVDNNAIVISRRSHWKLLGPLVRGPWEPRSHLLKEFLNILAGLRTDLFEKQIVLLGNITPLLLGDLPLRQVDLIADQTDDDIAAPLVLHIFDPLADAIE